MAPAVLIALAEGVRGVVGISDEMIPSYARRARRVGTRARFPARFGFCS
jgi:hypothetical protein